MMISDPLNCRVFSLKAISVLIKIEVKKRFHRKKFILLTCCLTTKFLTPSMTNFELFDNKFENMLFFMKES